MLKYLVTACLFIALHTIAQQTCTLRYEGIILDKHDLTPVPFAKLQVKGKSIGALADSSGHFQINNLCPGHYEMVCLHHMGCKPVRFDLDLTQNRFDTLVIEFHLYELEEARVVANVFELSNQAISKPTENDQRLGFGKSLGEQLRQVPGVTSLNTGSSIAKPVIHGMHSNRIVMVNNGIRLEGQQWGSEHAPEIDPFLSSELTVVKGASALRYGSDALGGVVLSEAPSLKKINGFGGKWMAAGFSNGRSGASSALLQGSIGKTGALRWRVQGTLKKAGNIQTPQGHPDNTGVREQNFSGTLFYSRKKWESEVFYSQFNTQLGIYSGAHIGNLTDLYAAFNSPVPGNLTSFSYDLKRPRQVVGHESVQWKQRLRISERQQWELRLSRQYNQREEFDKHSAFGDTVAAENIPAFTFHLTTWQGTLSHQHKLGKRISGEAGISWQHQKNTWKGRYFIPNFVRNAAGIYVLETYHAGANDWEAGLRYDLIDLQVYLNEAEQISRKNHDFANLSASIGYARLFGHHLHVRGNVSTAWRAPQVNELYSNGLHHGAAAIEIGRDDLKKEQSLNAQGGFTYKSNQLTVQTDVWISEFSNFLYLMPSQPPMLTIKGAFPVFRFEQIRARFHGFDFYLLYKPFDVLHLQLKGAMVRATNTTEHSYLVGIPADRLEPAVVINLKGKKEHTYTISAQVPLVARQWRYEPNSDYVAPPKAYGLFNLMLSGIFQVRKQQLDLILEANNLFNTSYRDYLNRFRYFTDEAGRNISLKLIVPFQIKKNHE